MTDKYYVYLHRRLTDNKPFYIGKGSGGRAYDRQSRNPYWKNTVKKHGLIVEILFDNLSETDAFQIEKDTILELEYFNCPLTNLTAGGEGSSGLMFSDQQRLNIANGLKTKRYVNVGARKETIKRPSAFGCKNHFADKNTYTFVRLSDGLEVTTTRHDLCLTYGVNKQLLKKLFYAVPRKSADGWKLKR